MNEQYAEYINSREWLVKRKKRLALSDFKCEACGTIRAVEVHHLTYDRIYNESMGDLLPLCYKHHRLAEALIATGELSRCGDPQRLRIQTLQKLNPSRTFRKPNKTTGTRLFVRNHRQEIIMAEPWFESALQLDRTQFGHEVHRRYGGHQFRNAMLSNCFTLYDRARTVPHR